VHAAAIFFLKKLKTGKLLPINGLQAAKHLRGSGKKEPLTKQPKKGVSL
tara:strand:- start:434 stop:580 length:147 start_codon:yes stop_codon:yes gene_type:complete